MGWDGAGQVNEPHWTSTICTLVKDKTKKKTNIL